MALVSKIKQALLRIKTIVSYIIQLRLRAQSFRPRIHLTLGLPISRGSFKLTFNNSNSSETRIHPGQQLLKRDVGLHSGSIRLKWQLIHEISQVHWNIKSMLRFKNHSRAFRLKPLTVETHLNLLRYLGQAKRESQIMDRLFMFPQFKAISTQAHQQVDQGLKQTQEKMKTITNKLKNLTKTLNLKFWIDNLLNSQPSAPQTPLKNLFTAQ